MTTAPRAARFASSISHSHPASCVWVSDALLSDAIRRFSHTFRRHGSSVPGPLEARRRAARRHHANLASVAGGAPPPDIATLFGTAEHKGWWKDPRAIDTSSTTPRHLSFFDTLGDLTASLDVTPLQPWIPPEPPPITQTNASTSTPELTRMHAGEATAHGQEVCEVEILPSTLWAEPIATTMTKPDRSLDEQNGVEILALDRSMQARPGPEENAVREVKAENIIPLELSEVELTTRRPAISATQADHEVFKPFYEAPALAENALPVVAHFQNPVLTSGNTNSLADVKLLLDDAAYLSLKHWDVQEIEHFASRMNARWPDILQRSKPMLEADPSSAKLLIRLIRHNINLKKALSRGRNHATALCRQNPQPPTEDLPSTAGSVLGHGDAEQSIVAIARLLALQPGPSPHTTWNRVYWCYRYLRSYQRCVSSKILPALWHAGVTNYLHKGLTQTRLDWVVAKIGEIESKALAQALLKNPRVREEYEHAFRLASPTPSTSCHQPIHHENLLETPRVREGNENVLRSRGPTPFTSSDQSIHPKKLPKKSTFRKIQVNHLLSGPPPISASFIPNIIANSKQKSKAQFKPRSEVAESNSLFRKHFTYDSSVHHREFLRAANVQVGEAPLLQSPSGTLHRSFVVQENDQNAPEP